VAIDLTDFAEAINNARAEGTRCETMSRTIEAELNMDPERKGVGVLIRWAG